jgi:hypothetical protein
VARPKTVLAAVTGRSSFNIDFPGSLLAYSAGAIQVEVVFRLFGLPFLLWLVSGVVLRSPGPGGAIPSGTVRGSSEHRWPRPWYESPTAGPP